MKGSLESVGYPKRPHIVPERLSKETNSCSENITSSLKQMTLPDDALMKEMIQETQGSTKSWHKELLFGLFLHSDEAELSRLADKSNSSRLSASAAKTKLGETGHDSISSGETQKEGSASSFDPRTRRYAEKRARTSLAWDEEGEPCPLSLIPMALQNEAAAAKPSTMMIDPASMRDQKRRRQESLSVHDITQLECLVKDKFQKCSLGKQATRAQGDNMQNAPTEFVPFSLIYNECSMAGIAAWALQNNGAKEKNSTAVHCPAPAGMFRKCSHCHRWGHYDSECQELSSEVTIELCREIKVQKTLQEAMASQSKPQPTVEINSHSVCDICKSSHSTDSLLICHGCSRSFQAPCLDRPKYVGGSLCSWICPQREDSLSEVSSVTDLEGCEGFVIEQRKRLDEKTQEDIVEWGFPRHGWAAAIGVRRHDATSKDYYDESLALDVKDSMLAPGELCWVRQNYDDSEPPSERDNWWPSMVLSITSGDGYGPFYIVRRFATTAPRTKSSMVLPFFKHFERLGYNRVHGHHPLSKAKDFSIFARALSLAVQDVGCLSLSHALHEAREISGTSSKEDVQLQEAELPVETWDEAEDAVQDDFLIRAKRAPLIDCTKSTEKPEALLAGSVVAWFPIALATETDTPSMRVGIVLAANLGNETALVRPIRNWHDPLSGISQRGSFIVKSCLVGASKWMKMKDLHVISSGAPLAVQNRFSEDVLPKRLMAERERVRRSYQDAHKGGDDERLKAFGSMDECLWESAPKLSLIEAKLSGGMSPARDECGRDDGDEKRDFECVRPESRRSRNQKAWRQIGRDCKPSTYWMRILLQRFRGTHGRHQTDNAVRVMFKYTFHPNDVIYCKEKREWKLASELREGPSLMSEKQQHTSLTLSPEESADVDPSREMPVAGSTTESVPKACDEVSGFAYISDAPSSEPRVSQSPTQNGTAVKSLAEGETNVIEGAIGRPVHQSQGLARENVSSFESAGTVHVAPRAAGYPSAESVSHKERFGCDATNVKQHDKALACYGDLRSASTSNALSFTFQTRTDLRVRNEKAWRLVSMQDRPSVSVMRNLLQRVKDGSSLFQSDNAVTTMFKRKFHPNDVVYYSSTDEWGLATDARSAALKRLHSVDTSASNETRNHTIVGAHSVIQTAAEAPANEEMNDTERSTVDCAAHQGQQCISNSTSDDEAAMSSKALEAWTDKIAPEALAEQGALPSAPGEGVLDKRSKQDLVCEDTSRVKPGEADDATMADMDESTFTDSAEAVEETQSVTDYFWRQNELAWRSVGVQHQPPLRSMKVLLRHYGEDTEKSQTDNAARTRFKRRFHPNDVTFCKGTNDWILTKEASEALSSKLTWRWHPENMMDGVAESMAKDGPLAVEQIEGSFGACQNHDLHRARRFERFVGGSSTTDGTKAVETKSARSSKYAGFDNEKAWQRVKDQDIPSLQWMRDLLQNNFEDESCKSQTDVAVRTRFRRKFHPNDVIRHEGTNEWKLAPDPALLSARTAQRESNGRSTQEIRTFAMEVDDTKPAGVENATIDESGTFGEDFVVAMGPAERAKLRRERAKPKTQYDGTPEVSSALSQASQTCKRSEKPNIESSISEEIEVTNSEMDDDVKKMWEQGIYQVEAILDDRQVLLGSRSSATRSEYLIKWQGFGMEECTWEPKKNIWDACLVERYEVEKVYDKLINHLAENEPCSTSKLVLQALSVGRKKLAKQAGERVSPQKDSPRMQPSVTQRECPFCRKSFKNLFSHMTVHSSSDNFDLLKEAALVIRENWYE